MASVLRRSPALATLALERGLPEELGGRRAVRVPRSPSPLPVVAAEPEARRVAG